MAAADVTLSARLRHARLVAEREALAAVIPADPAFAHRAAQLRVRRRQSELEALQNADGWGVVRGTPVGQAAIECSQAHNEQRRCLALADDARFREGRQLPHQAERAAEREPALGEAYERLAAPERERIAEELPEAKKQLAELEGRHWGHLHFEFAYPHALRFLERL